MPATSNKEFKDLESYLDHHAGKGGLKADLAEALGHLANAAMALAAQIANGEMAAELKAEGKANVHGEVQKHLDVIADEAFKLAATKSPVAWLLSEEWDEVVTLKANGTLALAIDPLDGSANIAINSTIGTIFAFYEANRSSGEASFLQQGRKLLAAGYVVYGAQTELVVSLGDGTHFFTLNGKRTKFVGTGRAKIPSETQEFAVNASNYRHWPSGYRAYVDDCIEGQDGVLGKNYNMRWLAAVVGEAHRILRRGGIFIYPADSRKGYEHGRLRLIYECAPIAFLIEQAGGSATNGQRPILDILPTNVHQRCGLCFGSSQELQRLAGYIAGMEEKEAPLFGKRGLFRAAM